MTKTKLVKVIFEPDGTIVRVLAGTFIHKVAAVAGRAIESPCGGIGVCGKCRVVVSGEVSEPDEAERRHLTSEELAAGLRLACRTRLLGDTHVSIPESSISTVQKILSRGELRDCGINSGLLKIYCELPVPSLEDERAEFERLAEYVEVATGRIVRPNLYALLEASTVMKAAEYLVTAVLFEDELIGVESGNTEKRQYGIAYDLGSTTIVGYLMDLRTGDEPAVAAAMNPQMVYGDDLVSRISFAETHECGRRTLQSAAVDAINKIVDDLVKVAKISRQDIYKITVVGNTCMTHILLGIDVRGLGQSPYVPTVCSDFTLPTRELDIHLAPEAKAVILPNVAGFVGSDLVGVLLASMWEDNGATRLAVDIGTNGEMAFMHHGKTWVCSAAAGPAFEGAGISCGMRGGPGAIDSVTIADDVHITTIGKRRPIGICGSGLVDAAAQMLDAGIIDETGRLLRAGEAEFLTDAVRSRLIDGKNGVEFVLATRKESGNGQMITLTHADIRHLQLAKGSIHAAIRTLIHTAGADVEEVSEIMLAGAFGNYINVRSAIRIGLIPSLPEERVRSIGNAAGAGARLALMCDSEMKLARRLATTVTHVELAVCPVYQMELMERMMF